MSENLYVVVSGETPATIEESVESAIGFVEAHRIYGTKWKIHRMEKSDGKGVVAARKETVRVWEEDDPDEYGVGPSDH